MNDGEKRPVCAATCPMLTERFSASVKRPHRLMFFSAMVESHDTTGGVAFPPMPLQSVITSFCRDVAAIIGARVPRSAPQPFPM